MGRAFRWCRPTASATGESLRTLRVRLSSFEESRRLQSFSGIEVMSPSDAIARCREGRSINGAIWPMPLITCLFDLFGARGVFKWLGACVGGLLRELGRAHPTLIDAIRLTTHYVEGTVEREAVEERAWAIWSRRTSEGTAFTAVAQLLFAVARVDANQKPDFEGACSTPLCLLESLQKTPDEVFAYVIADFEAFVSRESG